jgi:hypothetical protein
MLGTAFWKSGNETRCIMDRDTGWMNMTDWAQYLFENTTLMDVPWTDWHAPCCSTFFMNADLIMRHSAEEYLTVLGRIRNAATLGYCGMFDRSICHNPYLYNLITPTTDHWSFILGGIMERAWAVIFTGRTHIEWESKRTFS